MDANEPLCLTALHALFELSAEPSSTLHAALPLASHSATVTAAGVLHSAVCKAVRKASRPLMAAQTGNEADADAETPVIDEGVPLPGGLRPEQAFVWRARVEWLAGHRARFNVVSNVFDVATEKTSGKDRQVLEEMAPELSALADLVIELQEVRTEASGLSSVAGEMDGDAIVTLQQVLTAVPYLDMADEVGRAKLASCLCTYCCLPESGERHEAPDAVACTVPPTHAPYHAPSHAPISLVVCFG